MKTDNRVRYTKAILKSCLVKLMREKNVHRISVIELCDDAQINRGTFYLHYNCIDDLISEMQEEFLATQLDNLSKFWTTGTTIDEIFSALAEHKDFLLAISSENGDPSFLPRLCSMCSDKVLAAWYEEYAPCPREKLELLFLFISHGSLEIMLRFFAGKSSLSRDELTKQLDIIFRHTMRSINEMKMNM